MVFSIAFLLCSFLNLDTVSKEKKCQDYPFQVLFIKGRVTDKESRMDLQNGDYLTSRALLSISDGSKIVVVNCGGKYFEYEGVQDIKVDTIDGGRHRYHKQARKLFLENLWNSAPLIKGIRIYESNTSLLFLHAEPNETILRCIDSEDVCLRWISFVPPPQKTEVDSFQITLLDKNSELIDKFQTYDSSFLLSNTLLKEYGFIQILVSKGASRYPETIAFLSSKKGVKFDCYSNDTIDNLLLGFALESAGLIVRAKDYFEQAANDKQYPEFSVVYDFFLVRNEYK